MKTTRNLIAALALAVSAQAGAAVTFTFNSTVLTGNQGNGLGATGGNSAIATSMNAALTAAGYSGATASVSGALATGTYSGEGHVVGGTLGTDTFVINNSFGIGASATDSFTLSFAGLLITSISFDYEIFPNADCQAGTSCATHNTNSNFPDITVTARNGANPSSTVFHQLANLGSSTLDPQRLGTSGSISLASLANGGATSLTFIDWPATIGIDNLYITTGCPVGNPQCGGGGGGGNLPEPGSLALLGLGCGALAWVMRRGSGAASLTA
jgi:hypothetical protein